MERATWAPATERAGNRQACLHWQPRHFSTLPHRPPPRRRYDVMISLCCIIYVAVFSFVHMRIDTFRGGDRPWCNGTGKDNEPDHKGWLRLLGRNSLPDNPCRISGSAGAAHDDALFLFGLRQSVPPAVQSARFVAAAPARPYKVKVGGSRPSAPTNQISLPRSRAC